MSNEIVTHKVCSKCGGDPKPLSEFYASKTCREGYTPVCKSCAIVRSKKQRDANREKISALKKEYHKLNREKISAKNKKRYASNRAEVCAKAKVYRDANKEKIAVGNKIWREANQETNLRNKRDYASKNKEKLSAKRKVYYYENLGRMRGRSRAYRIKNKEILATRRKENPGHILANNAKYRASKLQATPSWFATEKAAIEYLYGQSQELNRMGMKVHVDHIVPLRGKLVCGLHTISNLQLLLAEDNMSKHNRYDM